MSPEQPLVVSPGRVSAGEEPSAYAHAVYIPVHSRRVPSPPDSLSLPIWGAGGGSVASVYRGLDVYWDPSNSKFL